MTRSEALQILELESLPNSEELRRAHRQMVRVWHPDRFPGDEALISKANEKTAQINEAFGVLRKLVEAHPPKPSPQEPTTRQDPQPFSRASHNTGPNTKTSDTPVITFWEARLSKVVVSSTKGKPAFQASGSIPESADVA